MEKKYRNPLPTVDIIIEINDGIILIERANPPYGWALPGGFVDYGESLENSAVREAKEETSLDVTLKEQFHSYSDPDRDPRHHTLTTVFIASASGSPKAADDAKNLGTFCEDTMPAPLAFDHGKIIHDYFRYKKGAPKSDIFRIEGKTRGQKAED
ncbi:MAG: NUDIX hydrolase [Desulfobacterales bacterium]|nr:NUDIX hydrolase [Desulfobacterales bacterium]MDD4072480.1 NUDIX hydrolase [Desulfobacterales bacterium]MDD4392565.1 NUDIX hydrolase [Desulfobacterales bacterium]